MMTLQGFFSSDRTIQQYADDIWHVTPVDCSHTDDNTPGEEL